MPDPDPIGTVCIDTDIFDVDGEGRLTLKTVGERAAEDWPYDCDPATYNPIRFQSDGGLWTNPRADAGHNHISVTEDDDGQTWSSDGDNHNLQTKTAVVTNPSTCLGATGIIVFRADISYTIPSGGNYFEAFIEIDMGDGGGFDSPNRYFRDMNTGSSDGTYSRQYETTRLIVDLMPGEARTVMSRISGTASAGAAVSTTKLLMNMLTVTQAT